MQKYEDKRKLQKRKKQNEQKQWHVFSKEEEEKEEWRGDEKERHEHIIGGDGGVSRGKGAGRARIEEGRKHWAERNRKR